MQKLSKLAIPAITILVIALASFQGRRVEHLQDCEKFYRWTVSASTQLRMFGDPGSPPPGEDPAKYLDKALFAKLVEQTDKVLPEVTASAGDFDKQGKPFPRVVLYTGTTAGATNETGKEEAGEIITPEQLAHDKLLWAFAQSAEAAPLRREMISAYHQGRVAAFGSQLGVAGLYQERGTTISLANMFFGFRKMAANLVWLEVDRYWHKGMMHRMLPLMKTCVMLDPAFVDAYLLGAWHMAYNATAQLPDTPWQIRKYDALHETWVGEKETNYFYGVDFLKDGIRNNPRNYKLYFDLGYAIYYAKLNDNVNAIKYLSEAIRLDHDRWVRRTLYLMEGYNEQFEESKAGWESYLKWQPQNEVAPRFIKLMQGEINDRDVAYSGDRVAAAEKLAEIATARGDAAAAADWTAKAAEARKIESEQYAASKAYWESMLPKSEEGVERDVYADARRLRIEAMELRSQKRYEEAIVALELARWQSNEFWPKATEMMIAYKQEGHIPLLVTDTHYLERQAEALEYTRHLPKAIGGFQYRFVEGTWIRTDYHKQPLTQVQQDSEELLKLRYEHPEICAALDKLDGNVVLQAGDTWYEYKSKEPAKPSKLNPYRAG